MRNLNYQPQQPKSQKLATLQITRSLTSFDQTPQEKTRRAILQTISKSLCICVWPADTTSSMPTRAPLLVKRAQSATTRILHPALLIHCLPTHTSLANLSPRVPRPWNPSPPAASPRLQRLNTDSARSPPQSMMPFLKLARRLR